MIVTTQGQQEREDPQDAADASRARRRVRCSSPPRAARPTHPVWYYNLKADPDCVVIQDGPEPFDVEVRELDGDERAQWWERAVAAYPPYAEYQEKTRAHDPGLPGDQRVSAGSQISAYGPQLAGARRAASDLERPELAADCHWLGWPAALPCAVRAAPCRPCATVRAAFAMRRPRLRAALAVRAGPRAPACRFRCLAVTVPERRRRPPGLERVLVSPPGHDQPRRRGRRLAAAARTPRSRPGYPPPRREQRTGGPARPRCRAAP